MTDLDYVTPGPVFWVDPAALNRSHQRNAVQYVQTHPVHNHVPLYTVEPELVSLAEAFLSYLQDDSRSERRRLACIAACQESLSRIKGEVSVTKPTFTSNLVEAVADVGSNAYHRIAELESINDDLLAFAEYFVAHFQPTSFDPANDVFIKRARAAIAKAEGKP
jgi:hypothetical protein